MNEVEVSRVADIVADRVFKAMSEFIGVVEGVVRENEALRLKLDELQEFLFGSDEIYEADDGYDERDYEEVPEDEMGDFFDVDGAWEPDDDDGEPTFD